MLGFIDGTVQIPPAKSQPNHYASGKRCNDMILSWILNSISPELANSVIYSTTTIFVRYPFLSADYDKTE